MAKMIVLVDCRSARMRCRQTRLEWLTEVSGGDRDPRAINIKTIYQSNIFESRLKTIWFYEKISISMS
jgi:hypothetical protein